MDRDCRRIKTQRASPAVDAYQHPQRLPHRADHLCPQRTRLLGSEERCEVTQQQVAWHGRKGQATGHKVAESCHLEQARVPACRDEGAVESQGGQQAYEPAAEILSAVEGTVPPRMLVSHKTASGSSTQGPSPASF